MSASETVVETNKCTKCGADVRADTQFCYNCGGSVTTDKALLENGNGDPGVPEIVEKNSAPAPGLRSARDIKRRERVFERKPKQVIWEPELNGPDLRLIIVVLAAVIFTVLVIVFALYLR